MAIFTPFTLKINLRLAGDPKKKGHDVIPIVLLHLGLLRDIVVNEISLHSLAPTKIILKFD